VPDLNIRLTAVVGIKLIWSIATYALGPAVDVGAVIIMLSPDELMSIAAVYCLSVNIMYFLIFY
jgi:hypothetical protein